MSKYLITGGAGFIGSHFCHYFIKQHPKDYFVCIDALTYAGSIRHVQSLLGLSNFQFIHNTICDESILETLFLKYHFDYVIHFAAETHVDRSILNAEKFIHTNIVGTYNLLEHCRRFGVKRFHQISTDEVYGELPLGSLKKWTEEDVLKPSNPYSASKASADLLCMSYHKTYGMPITISRSCNNFGENQHEEKFIPLMIKKALHNEALPIYGNGLNERDWIYVLDHCKAIDFILNQGSVGQIYNVSGNCTKTNLTIAQFILENLDTTSTIEFVKDRPGHDLKYAVDAKKLEALGWKPVYNFEIQLKKVIEFYKNN